MTLKELYHELDMFTYCHCQDCLEREADMLAEACPIGVPIASGPLALPRDDEGDIPF